MQPRHQLRRRRHPGLKNGGQLAGERRVVEQEGRQSAIEHGGDKLPVATVGDRRSRRWPGGTDVDGHCCAEVFEHRQVAVTADLGGKLPPQRVRRGRREAGAGISRHPPVEGPLTGADESGPQFGKGLGVP